MDLFLFTNFFPFKRAEPFLFTEFEFAKQSSSTIHILALYGKKEDSILTESSKVKIYQPVFENAEAKTTILWRGLFNLSNFNFHLRELFNIGILFNAKRLYWFFISLFVTRAALSSTSLKELVVQIEKSEFPVLYFYWGDNLSWIIPYLKKRIRNPRLKIVVRHHGSDLYENTKGNYAPLRKKIFQSANLLFTVSEFGSTYLKNRYPEHASKIRVSRLGIADHKSYTEKPDKYLRILSVSNLVPLKRVDLIFKALQIMNIPVLWDHYGDGPCGEELHLITQKKRDGLQITLHGFVKNEDLMKDLQNKYFDVFVNVSTTEGIPVSIMEAFSFGIPAIATAVGGTPELVKGDSGILIDVNLSESKLASTILSFYLESDETKLKRRLAARHKFEKDYRADENYYDFYKQLAV
jgi:colanic acid/amylovoran biosynthesis glycosyltransferase